MSGAKIEARVSEIPENSLKLVRALALASVAVVVLQVSTAGFVALVDPGFAELHALGGKLGSIVVVAAVVAAWAARHRKGVLRDAILLFVVYHFQLAWLIAGQMEGFSWLRALHAPNALLVGHLGWRSYSNAAKSRSLEPSAARDHAGTF